MRLDIHQTSEELAFDQTITDYDFWRTLKNLNNEILDVANNNDPIPFDLIRWRAVIGKAWAKREDLNARGGAHRQ
ncbi:hypothetical protein GA830_16515 [Mesorhizobium sp. NBSH29]|uniref:hypothetical protein n=1 Tax=Mesorhizobium sp. NBSH29 TaxID=2654249 RepID=UPI00189647AC|nr:hypothetical protein [Mesorhizobium sp. NBSH29]QPC88178.1 hypothetical protein GA830_16515 [Mesorhizobium sp. NBSH29]